MTITLLSIMIFLLVLHLLEVLLMRRVGDNVYMMMTLWGIKLIEINGKG